MITRLFPLAVGVLLSVPAAHAAGGLPNSFTKLLAKPGVPLSSVSVYVQRLDQDKPRLAFNADQVRNPASVIKVVTTLAGLETLGPDFTWHTSVHIDGRRDGERLKGDLILKGEGDPYFTPEHFWKLLYNVRSRGIRHIDGDVILDASRFLAPKARRGDFDGKPHRAYNALPYALSLNFQAVQLTVEPDQGKQGLRVYSYPPLNNLQVVNKAKVVTGRCSGGRQGPVVSVKRKNGQPTVTLSGRMAASCDEAVYGYLLNTPQEQIAGAFIEIWKQLDGTVKGEVRPGKLTKSARLVEEIESRPLAHVAWGINKFSNNLMARHLLLTLAAESGRLPATEQHGVEQVRDWLGSNAIPAPGLVMNNGSGLSRKARISARTLGQILLHAFKGPRMPEFMASLPLIGEDGTTRRRMRKHGIAGRAHIKTGSIDHVSAMGGYVLDRSGKRWAVVMMINDKKLGWYGKPAQDALLSWIYKGAR